MSFSLTSLRDSILTSIWGRRIGLDKDDFILGFKGTRTAIEDFDNSTGSTAVNYGMTRVMTTAASSGGAAYTLQAPTPGARKTLYHYGASTSCFVFGMAGSAIVQGGSLTSAGSTMISMFRQNACIELLGLSTAIWLHLGSKSSGNASSDMWGISFTATASS